MVKLLKFSASWCNPCKLQEKELIDNPIGIPIEHIDVDEDSSLTDKYNVNNLPTLILLEDDKEICRWNEFTKSEIIKQKL